MTSTPRRYVLVGCGKAKLDRAAPAREFYTGPLFRSALEVAEAEFGDDIWVLSAKYGLTDLNEVLEPYDLHLEDLTGDELLAWGRDVIRNLTDDDEGTPAHLTVYAGAFYVNALRAHLPKSWTLAAPMEGLGQGERLAWLKARRAALSTPAAANSAAPSPSAGPRASPLELRMSNAIPTTLTHEQRSEAFTQALVLEDGLKELEALKARLLAGLEAKAETMRQDHVRLMRAATTGVNPEAPEQQLLPLTEAAPAAPVQSTTSAPPDGDEPPPPEPPKGKSRNRSRKAAPAETGAKRTGASSARIASTAQASASQAPEVDDAVPAPRVLCCECGDGAADHKDGTGRCMRKTKGRYCKCKRFVAAAVDLPGAPGWKVRPVEARLSTGEGGERGHVLVGGEDETLPLHWVPRYGLAFQNGESVSAVYSHLGDGVTTLVHQKDPRWTWVPRKVLRALAEYLGATWPKKPQESDAPEPSTSPDAELPRMEAAPDHPCECDGCGATFKASELQPMGQGESQGFYCSTCKAEVDDFDSDDDQGVEVESARDARLRDAESRLKDDGTPLTAPAAVSASDVGALGAAQDSTSAAASTSGSRDDGTRWWALSDTLEIKVNDAGTPAARLWVLDRSEGAHAWYGPFIADASWVLVPAEGARGSERAWLTSRSGELRASSVSRFLEYSAPARGAMAACREELLPSSVAPASKRAHARKAKDPQPPERDATQCGNVNEKTGVRCVDPVGHDGGWHHGPAGAHGALRWKNEAYQYVGPNAGPGEATHAPAAVDATPTHKLLTRRGTAWGFTLGAVHGQHVEVQVHKQTRTGAPEVLPAGRWSLDPEGWTNSVSLAGIPHEVVKALSKALSAEASPAREAIQRVEVQNSPPVETPEPASGELSAWRVELPERNEHTIIRLWLVNDSTGERKPATWWSGVSSLRRSHHLSGPLEGEQLAAHVELVSWWRENADTIVRPLAEACREGRVPGLKVYEPETLGAGPHIYALSNGRSLEAWEGEGEEAEPHVDFVSPTERSDMQLRVGPFVLSPEGHLTTANTEAAEWSAENESVVAEAESFIARGFIFELRGEVAP